MVLLHSPLLPPTLRISSFVLNSAKASSYTKSSVACARSFENLGASSSFSLNNGPGKSFTRVPWWAPNVLT